jgi:hypothetical protein
VGPPLPSSALLLPYLPPPLGRVRRRHVVDVWHGLKMLEVEWDDNGRIDVVGDKRGDWEGGTKGLA